MQLNINTFLLCFQAREAAKSAGKDGGLSKTYLLPRRWPELGGGSEQSRRTMDYPQSKSTGDKATGNVLSELL